MGKNRTRDHTEQNSYTISSDDSQFLPPELSFFDRKTSVAFGTQHVQATAAMFFFKLGFRKCENVFTQEYHIPLGRCP
jgi:hypothetical protein